MGHLKQIEKNNTKKQKKPHRLQEYREFTEKTIPKRKMLVTVLKLYWNSLSKKHFLKDGKSKHRCKQDKCHHRHHTLRQVH